MQHKRTCPSYGADIADDRILHTDLVEPRVEEQAARLGPTVVEHQSRDYLGRPFGVADINDVDIPITDK